MDVAVLQVATSETNIMVDHPAVVTIDPEDPLSFNGVYEPPRAGATDSRPRFRAARGLLAKIG